MCIRDRCDTDITGTVTLTIFDAPEVTAGDVEVSPGNDLILNASSPTAISYAWTGPNSFSSSDANPTVTTDAQPINAGDYTVEVTNEDGCSTSETITVSINGCSADAGENQTLDCNVTNLGAIPVVLGSTGQWSEASGDGAAEFEDVNDPATLFRGTPGVSYTLQWSVTGGTCGASAAFDLVTITFNGGITVDNDISINAIPNDTYIAGGEITSAGMVDGTAASNDVTFKAGEQIILRAGFMVVAGADFHAIIDLDAVSYTHLTLPTICSV